MNVANRFLRILLINLVNIGFTAPLVYLVCRNIKNQTNKDPGKITILALNEGRFRGDLECLQATGEFNIIRAPFIWQARLYIWFYGEGTNCFEVFENNDIRNNQVKYRKFLKNFLPGLYEKIGVDVVIGAAIHYRQDYDWGAVSDEIGIPFLVLHREGNVASQSAIEFTRDKLRKFRKFHGTRLLLHNELQREICTEEGYVSVDRSDVVGVLRMDELLINGDVKADRGQDKKRITLFDFGPGTGVMTSFPAHWPHKPKEFLYNMCLKTHVSIFRFAESHPEVEIVIKPKWGGNWINHLNSLYESENINLKDADNILIEPETDVHELLRRTDVVVAFGSTTLMEAAILNLPVIMPYFDEAAMEEWQDSILYNKELACFDLAKSPEHLCQLMEYRLSNREIDNDMHAFREKTFARYISPLEGNSTERVCAIIKQSINDMACLN